MNKKTSFLVVISTVFFVLLVAVLIPCSAIAQGSGAKTQQALADFSRVFRFIQDNYVEEIDPDVLLEGALEGLLNSLDDPHSSYIRAEGLRSLQDTTSGEFGGVGMYISKRQRTEDGDENGDAPYIEVVSPIADTPADRLGVRANDLIVEIDGQDTIEMSIDDAVNALRGTPGSRVEVRILRGTYTFDLEIMREIIEIPSIRSAYIDEHNIGYIRIIQFTPFAYESMTESINGFATEGYQSLIIDVRQNPGGLLSSAVDVASLFLDGKFIVGTSGRNQDEIRRYTSVSGRAIPDSIDIIVLIDEGTASASEILAGALKDHERATLIGEKTFGKGSVQQVRTVDPGAFRLTMSLYYTPQGSYIDEVGIIPDIIVEDDEFNDEQAMDYTDLLRERVVEKFVNGRQTISEDEIQAFITERLNTTTLTERHLRKLVKDEILRAQNILPVFDLEYDTVLQRAVEYISS